MSKRIIHIKTILLAFLIAAFIGNIFILFCHFHYDLQKTIIITFILFIIYIILGCYIFFIDKCQDSWLHWLYRLPKQLFIISFFIMFFLISAYISEYTNIPFSARVCLPINAIFVFCIGNLICWIYVVFLTKYSLKIRIKISPKKLIPILLLAIIPTLIRLPMLDTLQRWDAGEYYYALGNACQSFTYSWSGFFDSFRLCNHTTLGFSLLMAPGEFLNPRGITGVLIINLLLTTGSVICLYLLLKKVFNQISDRYLWGIAMIYSIVPFFLGSFGYLTPDYIVPIVFIFAVMAEYKKEYLLEFFWFSIMANTKEFSIIIIFGYFLAKFIFTIISNWKHKDCYKIILRNGSLWAGLLSGLFFLLILFLQGGILWKGGNPDSNTVSFSNTGINCFGINFSYILFRLKQHFILNFSWIITLLVIINIIIYWIKRKKSTYSFIKNEFLVSLVGALGFAILSNMIYITAGAYRYATFFLALYPVFAILFCYKTVKYFLPKACKLMIPIIGCLFFIETYIHIDPISKLTFSTASTGSWYTVLSNYEHTHFGNDLCNNYQYTFIDKCFDKMLNEINYNGSQDIIIVGNQAQGSQFNGNGNYYKVCWNKTKAKRVIYDENQLTVDSDLIAINMLGSSSIEAKMENQLLKNKAVVFFLPYYYVNEEQELENLRKYYNVGSRKETKSIGGSLFYYELTLKQ